MSRPDPEAIGRLILERARSEDVPLADDPDLAAALAQLDPEGRVTEEALAAAAALLDFAHQLERDASGNHPQQRQG